MFTEDDIPERSRQARAKWGTDGWGNLAKLGDANTYMLNGLSGVAMWLDSRSGNMWAVQGHHSPMMKDWAETLNGLRIKLKAVIAAETMPVREATVLIVDGGNWIGHVYGEDGERVLGLDGQFTVAQLRAAIAVINGTDPAKEEDDEL